MAAIVARPIRWQDMPRLIKSSDKKIRRAAAKTITAIAYDARDEITADAKRKLDFRGVARNALGFRVEPRSAKPDKEPDLEINSKRGWLHYHLLDSDRPKGIGVRVGKRRYLFIPSDRVAQTTRRGRLTAKTKRLLASAYYVNGSGGSLLAFYRRKRGDKASEFLGTLARKAKYKRVIKPEQIIQDVAQRKGQRLFRLFMDKQG